MKLIGRFGDRLVHIHLEGVRKTIRTEVTCYRSRT